jgi:hypothetical protein
MVDPYAKYKYEGHDNETGLTLTGAHQPDPVGCISLYGP